MEEVRLSEETLLRLGDIIAEKILYAKSKPEPWISIQEISKITGRSKRSIYRDVEEHKLPHIRGGRCLKFKLSEVESWLLRRR